MHAELLVDRARGADHESTEQDRMLSYGVVPRSS